MRLMCSVVPQAQALNELRLEKNQPPQCDGPEAHKISLHHIQVPHAAAAQQLCPAWSLTPRRKASELGHWLHGPHWHGAGVAQVCLVEAFGKADPRRHKHNGASPICSLRKDRAHGSCRETTFLRESLCPVDSAKSPCSNERPYQIKALHSHQGSQCSYHCDHEYRGRHATADAVDVLPTVLARNREEICTGRNQQPACIRGNGGHEEQPLQHICRCPVVHLDADGYQCDQVGDNNEQRQLEHLRAVCWQPEPV